MTTPAQSNREGWIHAGTNPLGLATQLILIGGVLVAYFFYPVSYIRLIAEDNIGEFATFIALMVASAFFMLVFSCRRSEEHNYWHVLLGVGTLFVAMEEISWGQRLMGLGTGSLRRRRRGSHRGGSCSPAHRWRDR